MSGFRDPDSTPPTPDDMLDLSATSPTSPGSPCSSQASTPLDPCGPTSPKDFPKRVPSLRAISDPSNSKPMNPTSTPQGVLNSARMPIQQPQTGLSAEHLAKTRAFLQSRQSRMGTSPKISANSSPGQTPKPGTPITAQIPSLQGGMPNLSNGFNPMKMSIRPGPGGASSAPAVPKALGLGARRGLKLPMGDNPVTSSTPSPSMNGMRLPSQPPQPQGSFNEFSKYIDTEHGYLKFDEARVFDKGVEFADGQIFSISLDEIEVLDELGKGNYGTVYKVKHAKPTMPRFGPGLSGFRQKPPRPPPFVNGRPPTEPAAAPHLRHANCTTGRVMAMKEIRLELDEQKFKNILKELIILHRCSSPYIIDFYGAFFQEGSVYMCIEYMDGGSIDKLYSGGISEGVLKKITYATINGLLELKEKHQIIHRDVKPTNILANTSGQVKICDFGVSGNLVASKAMTNIGCQSYMAPERISGGALAVGLETSDGSYDVTSDIWSLGLSIIECATGRYPYPPEVSSSILGQLNAIVEGDPPDMPSEGFSNTAREFVKACLNKVPSQRPTYKGLLQHSWLASLSKPGTIAEEDEDSSLAKTIDTMSITASSMETGDKEVADWVKTTLAKNHEKEARGQSNGNAKKPALHTAPLAL